MNKLIFVFLFIYSSFTFATSVTQDLEIQVNDYLEVLNLSLIGGPSKEIVLTSVRVRTILEFGIEIPFIADFSIQPEVELYFSKK